MFLSLWGSQRSVSNSPSPSLCHLCRCYQLQRTYNVSLTEHPDHAASLPSSLAWNLQPSSTFVRQSEVIPALRNLLPPFPEALSFQIITWLILSSHHLSLSAISPPHPGSSPTPPPSGPIVLFYFFVAYHHLTFLFLSVVWISFSRLQAPRKQRLSVLSSVFRDDLQCLELCPVQGGYRNNCW